MTILPIYKMCSKCGKHYIWNPDVGKISCPRCSLMAGKEIAGLMGKILKL